MGNFPRLPRWTLNVTTCILKSQEPALVRKIEEKLSQKDASPHQSTAPVSLSWGHTRLQAPSYPDLCLFLFVLQSKPLPEISQCSDSKPLKERLPQCSVFVRKNPI